MMYRNGHEDYDKGDDMTQEEVDALVAEQMKNLPDWWYTNKKWNRNV